MSRENVPVKYTLFLNLTYVIVNGVRTSTHALLLESNPAMFGDGIRHQVRGFGLDSAWSVFDLDVPSIEYTLTDGQSNHIMITDSHPAGRPLCSGAIMKIKDGPELQLIVEDQNQPIDIKTFEGTWGDRITYDKLWNYLNANVVRYWHAPNMPRLMWGPAPGRRSFGR